MLILCFKVQRKRLQYVTFAWYRSLHLFMNTFFNLFKGQHVKVLSLAVLSFFTFYLINYTKKILYISSFNIDLIWCILVRELLYVFCRNKSNISIIQEIFKVDRFNIEIWLGKRILIFYHLLMRYTLCIRTIYELDSTINFYSQLTFFYFFFFRLSHLSVHYNISLANRPMIVYNIFNFLVKNVKILILESIITDKAIFTLISYIP